MKSDSPTNIPKLLRYTTDPSADTSATYISDQGAAPTNTPEAEIVKPPVNQMARIVNSYFLQSPYEGKDWESVRKDLIEELTAHADQDRTRLLEQVLEVAPLVKPCRRHAESYELGCDICAYFGAIEQYIANITNLLTVKEQ